MAQLGFLLRNALSLVGLGDVVRLAFLLFGDLDLSSRGMASSSGSTEFNPLKSLPFPDDVTDRPSDPRRRCAEAASLA